MSTLTFVTANKYKVRAAKALGAKLGIDIEFAEADVDEIQARDGTVIARDKAAKIYEKLQKPIVITDDTWIIPGLGGFPGPYMKYMNDWLTAEDFLRLTLPLEDRRIILRQTAVYQDEIEQVSFSIDIEGLLLKEIRGASEYAHMRITSFDGGVSSGAETHSAGRANTADKHTVWHELAKWLKARES